MTDLEKAGFLVARTRVAHHFLRHTDGRVPVHSGEVNRPTLLKILVATPTSLDLPQRHVKLPAWI